MWLKKAKIKIKLGLESNILWSTAVIGNPLITWKWIKDLKWSKCSLALVKTALMNHVKSSDYILNKPLPEKVGAATSKKGTMGKTSISDYWL